MWRPEARRLRLFRWTLSFLDSQHLLIPDLLEESAPLEGNGGTALNLVLKACLPNEV